MDDLAGILDEQLVVGMALFLLERHGEGVMGMVERRIGELSGGGDEAALALYMGIAVELRRCGSSTARH